MNSELAHEGCIAAFWELVRCGLSGGVPNDELFSTLDDKMWEEVYRYVKVQAVIGVCYQAVQVLPEDCRPSWPLLMKWHVHTNYIIAANKKQRKVWFEMNRRFREAGIRPVLLKGMSIAAYYPSPLHRTTGDLDIYIEEFDRAIEVVESWGMEIKYNVWHHQFVYDGVDVELHHTYWGQEPTADICFKEIEDPEGNYMVLDELRNAQLQIEHVVHHLLEGGVGVRHLCDWSVFLAGCRHTLDFERLENCFKKKKLDSFVHVFSSLAAIRLGSPPLPVSCTGNRNRKHMRLLEQDMLEYGNFGTGNPEVDTCEFKRLPIRKRWNIVWRRMARAWGFRALCPVYVQSYIRSMVRYVVNSIISGRAFSH